MSRVETTDQADEDLFEIGFFIERDSAGAAERFVDMIRQKFELLADSPGLGRIRDELGAGLRSFPVGNYVVFYRPLEDGIEVVRVLSGYRDLDALFEH